MDAPKLSKKNFEVKSRTICKSFCSCEHNRIRSMKDRQI